MTNVAIVVLDTLRKDAFDEFFDWHPGTHFENAWSTSAWTVPAHGSLFTGHYPSEVGIYADNERLDCDRPVLAERLSEAGYTTRGWSANTFISPAFGYDRGFEEWQTNWRGRLRDPEIFDWPEFISNNESSDPTRYLRAFYQCLSSDINTTESFKIGAKLKAQNMGWTAIAGADDGASEALEFVRNTAFGRNEFLFMNLMEAHGPYEPPEEYRTAEVTDTPSITECVTNPSDIDAQAVRQTYDDASRYLSDVYQRIFSELESDFEYIITLGDHGELFGEHGRWKHGIGIYPELTHIPLAIYEGDEGQTSVETTVSIVDIYRTVLDIAGVRDIDARGQHLLANPTAAERLVERTGLKQPIIEKFERANVPQEQISHLDQPLNGIVTADGVYGYETPEGFQAPQAPERADELERRLQEHREDLDIVTPEGNTNEEVSEAVKRQLTDLGYA